MVATTHHRSSFDSYSKCLKIIELVILFNPSNISNEVIVEHRIAISIHISDEFLRTMLDNIHLDTMRVRMSVSMGEEMINAHTHSQVNT